MKKQVKVALIGAAVGMTSLVALSHAAMAQAAFPALARGIDTWMARAMEPCNPPTTTVSTPNSPAAGCIQSNGNTTDGTLGMKFAKLRVSNRGRIGVFATGFKLGDEVRARLTLRVTKTANTLHPMQFQKVTFQDVTIDCPAAPDAFNARPNGAIIGTAKLTTCLGSYVGLANGNIELVDVSLVNALNSSPVVAVPGLVR